MNMKINNHLVSAMLLIAISAPAVRADLITDPKEFNTLKNLTGGKRNNRPAPSTPKTETKSDNKSEVDNSKASATSDTKTGDKSNDKSSAKSSKKSKAKSSDKATEKSSEKSDDNSVAKSK